MAEVLEVTFLNGDVAGQTSSLRIEACSIDSLDVYVVAVDMVVKLTLLRVVIVYLVEEVGVEVGPFLEGKFLAEQTRSHVAGNECSLNEQGT